MQEFYNLNITYKNNTQGYARMSINGIIKLIKNEIDNIKNISIQ